MTIKDVAIATTITFALSTSALALSLTLVSSSHAEDTPDRPASQAYTVPNAASPTAPRDALAATPLPAPVAVGTDPAPVVTPAPDSAASIAVPAPVVATFPDLTLSPCPTEDSTNCYWDAAVRGNGIGDSFINWNGVYYYAR